MAIPLAVPQPRLLEDLLAHLPKSNTVEYRKGQFIYNAAQVVDRVYVVTEGKVLISRIVNSEKQVVVDICQPPEVFGEPALVNRFSRGEQATVLETAKVMSWPAAEIADRVTRQTRLGIALLQVLAQREAELTWRMETMANDTIHVRVARALIRLSNRIGSPQDDGSLRMPPLTHKMLSQYIGSTREIVTHHMTEFRRMGYLNYSRSGIMIYRDALIEWLQRNSHGGFITRS